MTLPYESLALQKIPILVSYIDDTERYQYINHEYEVWFGRTSDEVIGKSLSELLGEQAYNNIRERVHSALAGEEISFETEVPYKDAGTRWVKASYIPYYGSEGKVSGFFALVQDISESKRLDEVAHVTKDILYKTILDSIPNVFLWVTDVHGNVIYLNQLWLEQTGIDISQCQNNGWLEVVHPDDRQSVIDAWQNSLLSGKTYLIQSRMKTKTGYRSFDFKSECVRNLEGDIMNWVGVGFDVEDGKTEALQLSQAKKLADESNLAKTNFLTHMSHEIRTPLAAIKGYAEVLEQRSDLDPKTHEFLEIILRNSDHLASLVNDILDLSKIEAGYSIEVLTTEFSFKKFLQTLIDTFRLLVEKKGLVFLFIEKSTMPEQIESDAKLLRQILINLLGNAIKFTDQGQIELAVSFQNKTSTLVFTIKDSGIGIAPEDQKKVFEAFEQSPVTRRLKGGTGLGLTLSREYARRLGGDLILKKSDVHLGAEFELSIPVGIPNQKNEAEIRDFKTGKTNRDAVLKGKKILLVEDSPDIRLLMEMVLKSYGGEIVSTDHGTEGVRLSLAECFDLILMDIQLPDISGHDAIKQMRAKGATSPVVALTATATREEKEKCRRSGFSDYESKPISLANLPDKLALWLG
ncbi:MAG: PAS domain-containing protein [Oligoflexus sp.]